MLQLDHNAFTWTSEKVAKPIVIAGPCSAESEEQVMAVARELKSMGVNVFRAGIWKPRTRPNCFEGVGSIGLNWLKRVKEELGMYIAIEVANASHVKEALAANIDILWIGARTTVNPFAVQEIADALKDNTDISILIKNPVNPDVELWLGAIERIYNSGVRSIGVIHRGFGLSDKSKYRNPPQWHIPIELRRLVKNLPVFCDPSHISGRRDLLQRVSQEAMDLDFDGLMIETHCNPDHALSDAQQQITPADLQKLLKSLIIRDSKASTECLSDLRKQIDQLDDNLLDIIIKRMRIAREIGQYKKDNNLTVLQSKRYDKMLSEWVNAASSAGLGEEFVTLIMELIHEESVRQQVEVINS